MNEIVSMVHQTGALGVLCWLIWHTYTTMIPKMMDGFTKSLETQALACQKEQEAMTAAFVKALDDRRAA